MLVSGISKNVIKNGLKIYWNPNAWAGTTQGAYVYQKPVTITRVEISYVEEEVWETIIDIIPATPPTPGTPERHVPEHLTSKGVLSSYDRFKDFSGSTLISYLNDNDKKKIDDRDIYIPKMNIFEVYSILKIHLQPKMRAKQCF